MVAIVKLEAVPKIMRRQNSVPRFGSWTDSDIRPDYSPIFEEVRFWHRHNCNSMDEKLFMDYMLEENAPQVLPPPPCGANYPRSRSTKSQLVYSKIQMLIFHFSKDVAEVLRQVQKTFNMQERPFRVRVRLACIFPKQV